MLIACLNHGGVGASRGEFLCRWKFPYLIGLILFVLFENRVIATKRSSFSHLIESVPPPEVMQVVILLNWKVVPDLQCQHLEPDDRQIGFEGSQCFHTLALFLGSSTYRNLSDTFLNSMLWLLLNSYTAYGIDVLGTLCPELCIPGPGNTYKLMSLEYLPLQLLLPQPNYGTCFSCFLCLSFHNTGGFSSVPSGAGSKVLWRWKSLWFLDFPLTKQWPSL